MSKSGSTGWLWAGDTHYDAFGNVAFTAARGHRYGRVAYDCDYALLPAGETVYVGEATGSETVNGTAYTCGWRELSPHAEYHRVLGAIVDVTDVNGALTTVRDDGFGRTEEMHGPDPDAIRDTCTAATLPVDLPRPVLCSVDLGPPGNAVRDSPLSTINDRIHEARTPRRPAISRPAPRSGAAGVPI